MPTKVTVAVNPRYVRAAKATTSFVVSYLPVFVNVKREKKNVDVATAIATHVEATPDAS